MHLRRGRGIQDKTPATPATPMRHENDQFLKDGKSFRFIAGSFHYFRAHPATWQRHLRTMRAAGLNAVTT